ncbi:putative holin-like toxin [Paenibacillus alvei]|uniref:putative holin-like toxin n=1 Tax=Paenibacillus alvei TaxID=44250 RepID=UPI002E137F67
MEVKDALELMVCFGMMIIALVTLVVTLVIALSQHKKKQTAPQNRIGLFPGLFLSPPLFMRLLYKKGAVYACFLFYDKQ